MKEIQVIASRNYAVTIGTGIFSKLGATICQHTKAKTVCIISDSNVWPLYGQNVKSSLQQSNLCAHHFIFPAGENSKNSTVYLQVLNFLAEKKLTRSDCIVALGGGVVGDLAGFAAATYLRGIPYIQVPTTLLAMVDSSVGGKTGIDLPAGKNLCGAFYQPVAVLCDIETLNTLPVEILRDGCAEVIKYGILYDATLFAQLEKAVLNFDREAIISRCIELKRDAVAFDEWDIGIRMLLNLGHTIGHAIESCSDYSISHGQAVAAGIAIVCRAAKCPDTSRIVALLESFGLPTSTDLSAEALAKAAASDKKRSGGTLNLIIPKSIGHCQITPTPVENLKAFIEEGL